MSANKATELLYFAVHNDMLDSAILRSLVELGADLTVANCIDYVLAINVDDIDVFHMLAEFGVDFVGSSLGYDALIQLARLGYPCDATTDAVVDFLIQHGCSTTADKEEGWGMLHADTKRAWKSLIARWKKRQKGQRQDATETRVSVVQKCKEDICKALDALMEALSE